MTIPYADLLGDYKSLMYWFVLTLAIFLLLVGGLALRERSLNKQVEEFVEVTRVMSRSFLAVFRVNYVTNRYYMVKADNIVSTRVQRVIMMSFCNSLWAM